MSELRVDLGPCPTMESAIPVDSCDYACSARLQCRAYIDAIRLVLGSEPDGAQLTVTAENRHFGTLYSVACVIDEDSPAAIAYARRCEEHAPRTWREAGMKSAEAGTIVKGLGQNQKSAYRIQ